MVLLAQDGLSREEGLFVGWSSGSALHGALEYASEFLKKDDVMVILFPDHGTRYLAKVYNDQWMKDHGFFETRSLDQPAKLFQRETERKFAYSQ